MLSLFFACAPPPPAGNPPPPPPAAPPELWVSGYFSNAVHRFDLETTELVGRLVPVKGPQAIVSGDRGVHVVAEGRGAVLELRGDVLEPWASGLVAPTGLAALPDGTWAVGSYGEDRVLQLDADGAFLGDLATGLDGVDNGLVVDPEGRIWVPCYDADEVVVLRDGEVELRMPLVRPRTIVFPPDGDALVSSWSDAGVVRFGMDGSPRGTFATTPYPTGLALDGDAVWVASDRTAEVTRHDLATGEALSSFDPELEGAVFVAVVQP